jgi:hypothetical protein
MYFHKLNKPELTTDAKLKFTANLPGVPIKDIPTASAFIFSKINPAQSHG